MSILIFNLNLETLSILWNFDLIIYHNSEQKILNSEYFRELKYL